MDSEPEVITALDEEEGESEGDEDDEDDDWLGTEVKLVSAKLEVINVPRLVGVLVAVGLVVAALSTELVVAEENVVLDSTDVIEDDSTGTSSEELVWPSARDCPTTGGIDTEVCPAGEEEDAKSAVDQDPVAVVSGDRTVSWDIVGMGCWTVCV